MVPRWNWGNSLCRAQDDIAAGDPNQKDAFARVKSHPQEREAFTRSGSGQDKAAEQQRTVNVEVFDLCDVVTVHVGKDRTKPIDRRGYGSTRHKEEHLCNIAVQGGEEPLGTKGPEDSWEEAFDVAKLNRGVRGVIAVGAHLEARSWGEEDHPTRRIGIKEVGRQRVRGREGGWHRVPVDLPPTIGE